MKQSDKANYYKNKCELYKQYIQLLGGPQALDRIEHQWNIEQTNKVLTVHEPIEFNNIIKELAVYR